MKNPFKKAGSGRAPGFWAARFFPGLLSFYMPAVMIVAAWVIYTVWPENDRINQEFDKRMRCELLPEVIAESIGRLQRGQQALERWERGGAITVTRADENLINDAVAYASTVSTIRPLTNLVSAGGDMSAVSRQQLRSGIADLSAAIQFLRELSDPSDPQFCSRAKIPPSDQARIQQRAEAVRKARAFYFGSKDLDLFVLLAAFGALGAAIQGLQSVSHYLGENMFVLRWSVFYLSRPVVGAGVAVAIYFVVRAGIFSPANALDGTNVIGSCAVALLVGLFSGQAMDKLAKVADAFFESNEYDDSLGGKRPHISRADFQWIVVGTNPECHIHMDGKNFKPNAIVLVDGTVIPEAASAAVTGPANSGSPAPGTPGPQAGAGSASATPAAGGVGSVPSGGSATGSSRNVQIESALSLQVILKGSILETLSEVISLAVLNPGEGGGMSNSLKLKIGKPPK